MTDVMLKPGKISVNPKSYQNKTLKEIRGFCIPQLINYWLRDEGEVKRKKTIYPMSELFSARRKQFFFNILIT